MAGDSKQHSMADEFLTVRKGLAPGAKVDVRNEAMLASIRLEEQLEALRNCVEEYADLDGWEAVRSPETTSAWQKRWGHPTPWVDAQHALDGVSSPASEPAESGGGVNG